MDVTSLASLSESIGIGDTSSEKKTVTKDNTTAFQSLLDSALQHSVEQNAR